MTPQEATARKLGALKNLGPAPAAMLEADGLHAAEQRRTVGAVAAWCQANMGNPRGVSLMLLYALQGALSDCHWNVLPEAFRAALRDAAAVRLDMLTAD
ncbi:MAG: TfoX/Sxy family DNA transformation protein [Alphaproteobacteria bacterium]|nr:TfoX/Sxy family DNA transformation protein [Alphaproteobacteria bacterium]